MSVPRKKALEALRAAEADAAEIEGAGQIVTVGYLGKLARLLVRVVVAQRALVEWMDAAELG